MSRISMAIVMAAFLGFFPSFPVFADGEISEDSLFSGDAGMIIEIEEPAADAVPGEPLLFSGGGVDLGGKYRFALSSDWNWDPETSLESGDIAESVETDLSAMIFFSARPSKDLRFYGEVEISSPFTLADDDPDTALVDESRVFDDIIRITELFSDFHMAERVFFRAGKQTINWGVGYFFSPADLLNLTEIDPEDPEAELEGPVSVKVNIPFGVNNIYGYLVVPDGTEDLSGLAYAAKMEIVIGSSELGLGGYYRKGQPPAVMLTCTGSVSDLAFFAEGVASYGSDRTFVVPDDDSPGGYTTAAYDDQWFFQATAGAMYIWNDDESDLALTLAAQYLFNGAGYADPSPINTSANAGILAALMACGSLSPSDLLGAGMHYGAALVSLSMTEDLSVSAFWLGDISDRSGLLRLSVSWAASDDINITASLPYTYGTAGAEYSPFGSRLGFRVEFSLGSGAF